MLELGGIHVNYGAAPALWDVALKVDNGELVTDIGFTDITITNAAFNGMQFNNVRRVAIDTSDEHVRGQRP